MDQDDDSPIEGALCGACNSRGSIHLTDNGLRCADCRTDDADTSVTTPTYFPSLRTATDDRAEDIAANVQAFKDSLSDIEFDVELQDGTTYSMDTMESHAVLMKYGDNWKEFLRALARKVAEHYEKETEPTKLQDYAPWGASGHDNSQSHYDSHAELAPVVAYADLRAAKMQLGLMAMSEPDEESPSVVGLDDAGNLHQYTEDGRITVEFDPDGGDD